MYNPQDASQEGQGGGKRQRGDEWLCVCGNSNFAFRTTCNMRKCGLPRGAKGGNKMGGGGMPMGGGGMSMGGGMPMGGGGGNMAMGGGSGMGMGMSGGNMGGRYANNSQMGSGGYRDSPQQGYGNMNSYAGYGGMDGGMPGMGGMMGSSGYMMGGGNMMGNGMGMVDNGMMGNNMGSNMMGNNMGGNMGMGMPGMMGGMGGGGAGMGGGNYGMADSRKRRGGPEPDPGSREPGDWYCMECGNMNFAFRDTCNMRKCGASKPTGGSGGMGGRPKGPEMKKSEDPPEGSWTCSCGNVNYPFRTVCNRRHCGLARGASAQPDNSQDGNQEQES